MTIASTGLAIMVLMLSGYALSPKDKESADAGNRVESDSFTDQVTVARCISYNINKKFPDLMVRYRPSDTADGGSYLILTSMDPTPKTFGVIRVDQREAGSHLTTWLPNRSRPEAPDALARRLVAGC